MITSPQIIPLEGDQSNVFQSLDTEQQKAIDAAAAPFIAQRNAMASIILAGKGLLHEVNQTPGVDITVLPDGIHLTPPKADG